MNAKIFLRVGVLLSLALLGAAGIYFYLKSSELRRSLGEDEVELARRRQLPAPEARPAGIPRAEKPLIGDEAEGGPGVPAKGNAPDMGAIMSQLQHNPAFQRFMAEQARLQIDDHYGRLFSSLNLPPAQLAKLKDILVEKQLAISDTMTALMSKGLDPYDPANRQAVALLRSSTDTEIEDSIHSELGDGNYAAYQNYTEAIPQQNVVAGLSQRLNYTPTPLQDGQAQQLAQILARTTPPRDPDLIGPTTVAPISDEAIDQAAAVLSQPQIDALRQMQLRQRQKAAAPATAP